MLSPRTGLSAGERGQEQVREAKKQRKRLEIRPRTNLSGGDLVRSTFLVLTFAFALTFMAFFLLHAAKVRSSCEEGPGQSALQSAYHNPKLDVSE